MDLDGNNFTEDEHMTARLKGSSAGGSGGGPQLSYLGGNATPISGGRHGGTLHKAMVNAVKLFFNAMGFNVSDCEHRVTYDDSGKYRYPDVTAKRGDETVYIQVGKTTSKGDPIAREQRAIDDLLKTGCSVFFYPYDD